MPVYQFSRGAKRVMHHHKRLPAKCVVSVSLFDRSCLFHCPEPNRLSLCLSSSCCLLLRGICLINHHQHFVCCVGFGCIGSEAEGGMCVCVCVHLLLCVCVCATVFRHSYFTSVFKFYATLTFTPPPYFRGETFYYI